MYLSLDTGKRNGWTLFGPEGSLLRRGVLLEDDFLHFLSQPISSAIDTVICENFRVFPHMGNRLILNTLIAVRMIGAVQLACHIHGWALNLQEPNVMRTAVGHLGYKYGPKTHIPDHISAHGHGFFWLEKHGILTLEKARKDKEAYESRAKGATSS